MSASERQDKKQMPRETGTRQGGALLTGGQRRQEGPAEDPPPEGRATHGTRIEHAQTTMIWFRVAIFCSFPVAGTAGTVNVGVIDDLEGIADFCE